MIRPGLREMRLDVGLGRFDQGFIPGALAARTFARLVFSYPVLADVKPQKLEPRVFSFEGVTDVALVSFNVRPISASHRRRSC